MSQSRDVAHVQKYKPLLHCTESLKRDKIESFYLQMADEHI